MVLLLSSSCDFQLLSVSKLSDAARMKISTSQSEAVVFSQWRRNGLLRIGSEVSETLTVNYNKQMFISLIKPRKFQMSVCSVTKEAALILCILFMTSLFNTNMFTFIDLLIFCLSYQFTSVDFYFT